VLVAVYVIVIDLHVLIPMMSVFYLYFDHTVGKPDCFTTIKFLLYIVYIFAIALCLREFYFRFKNANGLYYVVRQTQADTA